MFTGTEDISPEPEINGIGMYEDDEGGTLKGIFKEGLFHLTNRHKGLLLKTLKDGSVRQYETENGIVHGYFFGRSGDGEVVSCHYWNNELHGLLTRTEQTFPERFVERN
jgi:hypothetical protein